MSRSGAFALPLLALLLSSCSGPRGQGPSPAKSMDQIYADEGRPVRTRSLQPEDFSVSLKFPTVLRARNESTAYASMSDVVREIKVRVGDSVARDQVLISFDHAHPAYLQARASFDNAEAAYNRSAALFGQAEISKQDFDNARMRYDLARAALKSASDMIDVKAPIDGVVTRINVRQTENVRAGEPLFTISNRGGFEARFYVGAEEIEQIRTGARASIDVGGQAVQGGVTEVSLDMDADKKAFPVTATFGGGARGLVSGISTDVAVEVYRNPAALVVARRELVRSGDSYGAFVAQDGRARRREVLLGRTRGLDVEIAAGLQASDQLVSEGVSGLVDGAPIKVVPTAPTR